MEIVKTIDGADAMLSLNGALDVFSAPRLAEELDGLNDGIENLVLDLEHLDYLSSAGLRQIVRAQKRMEGRGSLTLIRVSPDIKSVFEMTGLSGRLNILS